jgi:hypothetical protein
MRAVIYALVFAALYAAGLWYPFGPVGHALAWSANLGYQGLGMDGGESNPWPLHQPEQVRIV